MGAFLRTVLAAAVGAVIAVSVSTLPTRAADDSKALQVQVDKLKKQVKKLEAKLAYMHVEQDPINGLSGPHVIFEGCNVHVRSGSGDTTDGTIDLNTGQPVLDSTPRGLGNLIVGYNELPLFSESIGRNGSHNLIVGVGHSYPNVGGVALGQENKISGALSNITGGFGNSADGAASSVSGGQDNLASGSASSVSGGKSNRAFGVTSSVSGGALNTASSDASSVSGGYQRSVSGFYDWAAGSLFQSN